MIRFFTLVLIVIIYNTTFAQKVGKQYLPPKSNTTPEWFAFFYDESKDFSKFNIFDVDEEVKEYEEEVEKEFKKLKIKEEDILAEENEDIYLLYYKRWRKSIERNIQPNGSIVITGENSVLSNTSANKLSGPSSSWSLIGPIETYWDGTNNKAPWQSNLYALAVAPSNPNILYACPESGNIFKSTDKGLTWNCVTINYPIRTCSAIAIDPSNPDIVYAGRTNQLMQTNDGGATWTISQMPWGDVNTIIIKPSNPNEIFVATSTGLYRKVAAGSYTIAQNSEFNIGTLSSTSPKWNRNNTGTTCTATAGTNQYYEIFPFTVSTTGSYTFYMCTPGTDWDGFASVYQNAFNGANPCGVPANHLYSDDDANSGGNCNDDPLITVALTAGTSYFIVTSSWNNNTTGAFQWNFTGPAGATLSATATANTWTQVTNMNTECPDVSFKADDDNILYCLRKSANFSEFWRSADGGLTFAPTTTGWSNKGIVTDGGGRLTVTPANPNIVYAVLLASTPISKPYIFKSTDAGITWDTTCTGESSGLGGTTNLPLGMSNGQGYYDLDIIANQTNANDIIVATTTAYKSTDGGVTFNRMGGYGGAFGIHPDIQEMICTNTETWIATDGGLTYSTDFFTSTANAECRMKGIFSSDMWGFAQGWNEDIVGGGRYHNGNTAISETYPSGEAIRLGGGEAPTGYYMIGRPRYIAFSDITPKIVPILRSDALSNFNFTKYPNEDGYGSDMSEMEFFPYCYNHIYVGNGNILYKSTDGGISWSVVFDFGLQRVKKFVISRSNPDVFYLATAEGSTYRLKKSTDGGASWVDLALPAGASGYRISIAISAVDENIIWITSPSNSSNNRIFKSVNGGSSWTNLTSAIINGQAYTKVIYQFGTDGGVYLTGDNAKVFYRNNTMSDWVSFNNGLPMVSNNDHVKPFYRDAKLRSASGHGIWQVDFYEDASPVAQPTVDKLKSTCPRDTFYFEDYSAFKQAGGTWTWSFPGAAYVSSTSVRNPKVVYSGIGNYDFSLTVTNAQGSSTKTILQKIQITGNDCQPDTIPGKLLTLTAVGDYAQQSKAINITTNTITLSCWIKPNGIQMGNAGIIFSGNGGATGMNFRNSNQIGYHWADGAGSYNWAGGPTIPANEWSHLALVITPTSATIYLNGNPYIRTATHNPVLFNQSFQFGIDRGNTSRNFIGQLDEVCMYNRALSQNEIRELMNLTRNNPNAGSLPSYDASLIAYYQFNEGAGAPAYDKIGNNHVFLSGGAIKTDISSAPVGGGVFQRMNINTGGAKDFTLPGVELIFPATGTYPNGDLVVTRLNVPSYLLSAPQVLPDLPPSYWVIRNYGTNAAFTALNKVKFYNVNTITPAYVANPSFFGLYKRGSNADTAWGSSIDMADLISIQSGSTGSVEFSSGLSLTGFSQFSIGNSISVLPVELISFNASLYEGDKVLVAWSVNTEINFFGYDVESSVDGIHFNKIGFVESNHSSSYNFIDNNPIPGLNYYRLKLLDKDGTFSYSMVRVVKISSTSNNVITIYPNPTKDGWINVNLSDFSNVNNATLIVVNELGQLIKTVYFDDIKKVKRYKINLPESGVYILNFSFDDGTLYHQKIIVE